MTITHNSTSNWIRKHPNTLFLFLAFAIPLAIRTIPEILMGPYIVGFDTMGFYVPNALLWLHNGINLWNFLSTAPLFYAIFVPVVGAGASAVFTLKAISPLLLGFLGLSIYAYARKGLTWSPSKSAFVAILGTVYFVALRASWDQLREELSLVFVFVVLMLLIDGKGNSWKRFSLVSLALLAVVLSDQIGAVIVLGIMIFTIVPKIVHRDYVQTINLVLASLPAALYFILVYVTGFAPSGVIGYSSAASPLASWTGFASYQAMLISGAGFFLYCFLPLLPLVVISFRRFGNLQLRSWLLLTLILALLPLSVSPFRWLLMLIYPLAFYATEAISRLNTVKWKRLRVYFQKNRNTLPCAIDSHSKLWLYIYDFRAAIYIF